MRVLDKDGKALDNVYCIGDANGERFSGHMCSSSCRKCCV